MERPFASLSSPSLFFCPCLVFSSSSRLTHTRQIFSTSSLFCRCGSDYPLFLYKPVMFSDIACVRLTPSPLRLSVTVGKMCVGRRLGIGLSDIIHGVCLPVSES
ncbi:hypothetical protein F2P81_018215 [Scophthalmus maximus]|uniref:Uncharacterized protein n=1 Tax=Scophthalmus maximus TaxID=52904 RepID=A0A6A4SBL1_SCOMX|nr:hypothetical protein F2P81_018215 [Scophthalmus maximus]